MAPLSRSCHAPVMDSEQATSDLAVVLVRPQLAVNIGTAARAMANFGLSDLRLVAPRQGWPLQDIYRETAEAAAAGAVGLLERARVFPTVAEAIADLQTVYATTARERGQGKTVMLPSEAMPVAVSRSAAGERSGVLFGPERTGLDNDDVVLADTIITFPVDASYGSLNLAQAVLLVGYEWFRARHTDYRPFAPAERSPPAKKDDLLSFFGFLEDELTRAGYFRPEDKAPIMRRNLRNIFQQIALTEQDVRTLTGRRGPPRGRPTCAGAAARPCETPAPDLRLKTSRSAALADLRLLIALTLFLLFHRGGRADLGTTCSSAAGRGGRLAVDAVGGARRSIARSPDAARRHL